MNTNETLNFNYSDIWKSQWNVGSTRYINVIDGTERVVPWGHYEWIGAAWGAVFSSVAMAAVIWTGYKLVLKFPF